MGGRAEDVGTWEINLLLLLIVELYLYLVVLPLYLLELVLLPCTAPLNCTTLGGTAERAVVVLVALFMFGVSSMSILFSSSIVDEDEDNVIDTLLSVSFSFNTCAGFVATPVELFCLFPFGGSAGFEGYL
jgi:hypothetical protein